MLHCCRPGCGKEYTEETNTPGSCWHHTGQAVFHEGQKGWSCCPKRVLTFEEFLTIPGCTAGKHSPHQEVQKHYEREREPIAKMAVATQDGKEVYKTGVKVDIPSQPKPTEKTKEEEEVEELDPPDAVIPPGTPCKHRGCNKTYTGEASRTEQCVYHPGAPIFHETLKQWSCCGAKAMDFEKFLEFEGCKTGVHKFLSSTNSTSSEVECRYDWYQGAEYVVVTIYAKKVNKEQSSINIEPNKVIARLKFQDGKTFTKDIPLSQLVDPKKSSFEFVSTKVEVKLFKADGASWTSLEPQ